MLRLAAVFLIGAAALIAGGGRLAYITYEKGAELSAQALEQHKRTLEIPAQRGSILDAQGRALAASVRRPSVFVDVTQVSDFEFAAFSLAPLLGLAPADLLELLQKNPQKQYLWVKREVGRQELERFRKVRDARGLKGFEIQDEVYREYPQGNLAAHVLGFYGGGGPGGGIELEFDEVLRGRAGSRTVLWDEDHNRLATLDEAYSPPADGHSVVLTIDSHIQRITEQHLHKAVEQNGAAWGAAAVMEPSTGEILAMASFPDFDPNQPIPPEMAKNDAAAKERLRNRTIGFVYEPGSIFKPFIASKALNEGRTRLDEVFHINGPTHAFGRRIIHDTHTFASLPLYRVIGSSSNIGMALLGTRLGNERLHAYVSEFGFGKATGVELPGEEAGLLAGLKDWTGYSSQSIPIGQEIAVTSLQLLTAFSVLATDGTLYRPRLVRGIIAADGRTIADRSEPVPIRRVLEPHVAREFRLKALVETVVNGTGTKAAIPDYQVFGKTGTAQVAAENRRGYATDRRYVGSFLGGAPAGEPRAVALVSIYHPTGVSYYGGTVAAPAVAAILADTLAYLRVPAELSPEIVKPD